MGKFTWGDVLDGLDEGLDIVAGIAAVIPGGQAVAIGAKVLDTVVEAANEDSGENDAAKQIARHQEKYTEPLEASKTIVEAVVQSQTSGVAIGNDDVIDYLEIFARSTGNKIDDKLVCLVKAYLECNKEDHKV